MENITFTKELIINLFDFGYVLIFTLLSIILFAVSKNTDNGIQSYIKARISLGTGSLILALTAFGHMMLTPLYTPYITSWVLLSATLVHSWLTYSTFLFLLESPRYLMRHFLIDGLAPTIILIIAGVIGIFVPKTQEAMIVIFGCIFGIKCLKMIYTCYTEYLKCSKEIDNYYDNKLDIDWIRNLLIVALIMSVSTIAVFYIETIYLYYYIATPIIYSFITIKVLNFMPAKIVNIRDRNAMINPVEEENKENVEDDKVLELRDKIGANVEQWVAAKRYCQPELTIKDVAIEMGTNHNYLSTYLNKCLNMNFQTWLNTLRIEESKIHLTSGEKISIEEIGVRVGIPQPYNFSRWFRVLEGTTPYRYKKEHSNNPTH
jgi:AraC-like DNA-binding protein